MAQAQAFKACTSISRVANQPSGVLGVQPLLGHPVLHLHGSVPR